MTDKTKLTRDERDELESYRRLLKLLFQATRLTEYNGVRQATLFHTIVRGPSPGKPDGGEINLWRWVIADDAETVARWRVAYQRYLRGEQKQLPKMPHFHREDWNTDDEPAQRKTGND
jgi:hypothetical protein